MKRERTNGLDGFESEVEGVGTGGVGAGGGGFF